MFKTSKHLRVGIAATAVAAAAAAAFATPASALVTETDNVKITSIGFDLGGDGFTSGTPDNPATVTWDHAWFGVVPEVTGRIHFEDQSGECARVKLVSYRDDGSIIGTDFGDSECASADGHQSRIVEEGGNDGVLGRAGAAEVEVILQSQNESGGWGRVGGKTRAYGPEVDTDDVLISRAELDFGSGSFVGGAPADPGTMTWNATATDIDPVLTGTLYAKNADDLTVRMQSVYREADGTLIETRNGIEHPITDDDLHTFSVNMNDFDGGGSSFGRNSVAKVRVNIQKKPTGSNVWETVGSQLVLLD